MFSFQDLKDYAKSKTFKSNLLKAFGFITVILITIYFSLAWYTHHGEKIPVPSFKGLKVDQLEAFVDGKDVDFIISDSIFDLKLPRGVVIDQEPNEGSMVKEGRTIYLTINAFEPPKIKMPNLIDVSLPQAEAILTSVGLKIGHLSYKADLAKNTVLAQFYKGSIIKTGDLIRKGSMIDMEISDGLGNTEVEIPNLVGHTYEEALFVIRGSQLVLGAVIPDEATADSLNMKVYRQMPESLPGATMKQGETIDLFITNNADKVKSISVNSTDF